MPQSQSAHNWSRSGWQWDARWFLVWSFRGYFLRRDNNPWHHACVDSGFLSGGQPSEWLLELLWKPWPSAWFRKTHVRWGGPLWCIGFVPALLDEQSWASCFSLDFRPHGPEHEVQGWEQQCVQEPAECNRGLHHQAADRRIQRERRLPLPVSGRTRTAAAAAELETQARERDTQRENKKRRQRISTCMTERIKGEEWNVCTN